MRHKITLHSLVMTLCCCLWIYDGQVFPYESSPTASLNALDRQILNMPFFQTTVSNAETSSLSTGQTDSAAAQAARSSANHASLQEKSARTDMAKAESVLTRSSATTDQKQKAQRDYDAAKMKAEIAMRTQEEQKSEASKQAMYEQQAAERCSGSLVNYKNNLRIISDENFNARKRFAAGDFPAVLTSLDNVKNAAAAAKLTFRLARGCQGFPDHEEKLDNVGNLLLEAQALHHAKGEAVVGDVILQLYLQAMVDGDRGDAARFIWDLYQESNRLLHERFGGKFDLKRHLKLPIEGIELSMIGNKEMEQLEFDLFQGFKRDMPEAARFDYARRFAKRDAAERNSSFYKDVMERLEHPARSTRSSGIFTDDQLFYYMACYYEFSGRDKEIPDIYRAYENYVDTKKEATSYRAFANYRELKSRLDHFLTTNNMSLPATTTLTWGLDKDSNKKLEEKKRLEALKKQPGMSF